MARERMSADERKAGADSAANAAAGGPGKRMVDLQEILAQAKGEVRKELSDALQKQKTTGRPLMDILSTDLDKEMFGRLWNFMRRPKIKQAMVETGVVAEQELAELKQAEKSGEAVDPRLGEGLVRNGVITREQFQDALAEQSKDSKQRHLDSPRLVKTGRNGNSTADAELECHCPGDCQPNQLESWKLHRHDGHG